MNELNNPLFEDKKEFLERQKQEYKNALLGDVAELKNQSQEIGKKVLIAGGALAGVWLVSKLFRGGNNKKSKTIKTGLHKQLEVARPYPAPGAHGSYPVVKDDGSIDYESALHHAPAQISPTATHYQSVYQEPARPSFAKSIMESELAKALSTQITAFLLIYVTKKLEEYMQVTKNADIAVIKEPETKDIEYSFHEEDAVKPDLRPFTT